VVGHVLHAYFPVFDCVSIWHRESCGSDRRHEWTGGAVGPVAPVGRFSNSILGSEGGVCCRVVV
jgi:hypothetical protein